MVLSVPSSAGLTPRTHSNVRENGAPQGHVKPLISLHHAIQTHRARSPARSPLGAMCEVHRRGGGGLVRACLSACLLRRFPCLIRPAYETLLCDSLRAILCLSQSPYHRPLASSNEDQQHCSAFPALKLLRVFASLTEICCTELPACNSPHHSPSGSPC